MHTVRWQDLCKPKRLGLNNLIKMNEAFLSKLSWKLQSRKEVFWCNLLKDKYYRKGIAGNILEVKAYDSSLWKNLAKEWISNNKYVQWEIGGGTKIKAWDDCWVQVGLRLRTIVNNPDLYVADTVLLG